MSKKRTAISALYLAGMILLAFAVLPHHHHGTFICFNTCHCHTGSDQAQHGHRHFPLGDEAGCVHKLFQAQPHTVSNRSIEKDSQRELFPLFSWYCIPNETTGSYYEPGSYSFLPSRDENIPPFYLLCILPGRAPPAC